MEWNNNKKLLIGFYKKKYINFRNMMVCGFDLDHTLIRPKQHNNKARVFPNNKDPTDWEFNYDNVKQVLAKLSLARRLIIYTNQSGLEKGDCIEFWKEKIDNIAKELNIPFEIYVSLKNDKYRKPLTFGWRQYINCNKETSFYCGDAMGRNNDHSCCDLMFSKNLEIMFQSPERIFQNNDIDVPEIKYELAPLVKEIPKEVLNCLMQLPHKLNIIINVGFQGSGKSYFSEMFLKMLKYRIVNQDTLGTLSKCKQEAIRQLEKKRNIVIDNTNMSKNTRHEWIKIGKKYNAIIIVIHFTTSIALSKHNNIFRNVISNGDKKLIPVIAYNIANKYFEEPTMAEGIKKIYTINPFFMDLDPIDTSLYKQYLLA
jgi:bifunctional polynucleotide phosphatase/kinase